MSTITSDTRTVSAGEPKPIIPPLALFYWHARDLSWLIVRLTAGGMLLVHGIMKVMPMAEKGFAATIQAFAAGSMARRGIEPAVYAAYAVFFIETIGAVLIILGMFTRFMAAAAAIEFAVITFIAHWPAGFAAGRGGWEYPLFWGLILFAIALRGGGPYSLDRKLGWELQQLFWGLILFAIALRGGGPYSLDRKLGWELQPKVIRAANIKAEPE